MNKIGVGIIGASPRGQSWAVLAHIPALQASPDFELRAVSTSNPASAQAAAERFGAPAFDNHHDLVAHPGVDLVVVSVRVPHHHELISAAITAGKMVYGEWPLGNGLAEAEDLAARASAAGLRTAIGLQSRFSPAIQHARRLIKDGYIGEVLATTLVGSGIAWGPETDRSHAYLYDVTQGATTLTVPVLHALDALTYVLGDFATVAARLGIGRKTVQVQDEGVVLSVSAPDQVAIFGGLMNDATVSVFYRGGVSRGSNLHWEINGTEGDLILSSPIGNVQVADLTLSGGRGADKIATRIEVPIRELDPIFPEGPAANLARLYAALASDIRTGTQIAPDFTEAVARHRLLASIEMSARSMRTVAPT